MFLSRWMAGCSAVFALALLGGTPGEVQAATRPVDWAALDPAYEGATFVKDTEVCQTCHEDDLHGFDETAHARAFRAGKMPEQGACESCHGPASKHVEDPEDAGLRPVWGRLSPVQQSAVCMQCHEGGARMAWKGGPHLASDVSCSSCHHVMEARSEQALLVRPRAQETCTTCHAEKRAQMSKTSHHPVREGRMDCGSCHNPHGSTPGLLRTATAEETS